MKKWTALFIIFFLSMTGCSKKESSETDKPYIVTTTGMIADIVQNIAGEAYQVAGLMGPGVDPHLYKASQGDIGKLSSAKIIFYNGLHLEGKMTDILEKMSTTKEVIAVSSGIEESSLIPFQGAAGVHDPHIWFDVSLWRKTIPVIQAALTKTFPSDEVTFSRNAAKIDSVFAELHQWVLNEIATIPEERRIMITAHDAFGYFSKAYNIQVRGLQGISTVSEYGVNDVNHLVDLIVEKKIPAIFVETSVPKRSIEAVMTGVLARNAIVKIGGTLYSDAMGAVGSGAETYPGMVRTNVKTIVSALQ